jgi:putative ABC transport system substrate-binding protein
VRGNAGAGRPVLPGVNGLGLLTVAVTLVLALLAVPLVAEAQQARKVYRVGVLWYGDPRLTSSSLPIAFDPFREGLRERGWVEGQNLIFESRSAIGNLDRRPALAAELVRLNVDVIVALTAGDAWVAQQATRAIPIVTVFGTDPVGSGLAVSLARPGGNVTGLSGQHEDVIPKMLDFLKTTVPKLSRVAVLAVPGYHTRFRRDLQAVAPAVGVTLVPVEVRAVYELQSAFDEMRRERAGAVIVLPAGLFVSEGARVAELAVKHRMPTMFTASEFLPAGGLMAYGASRTELMYRAAGYVDKILRGAKPENLPIEQPTKFELVVNLKTAKALGLTIPPSILVRADQVIE